MVIPHLIWMDIAVLTASKFTLKTLEDNKMADEVDIANENAELELAARIKAARGDIPPGVEGDCDMCGEWSGRLIKGACAPCRDLYGLE